MQRRSHQPGSTLLPPGFTLLELMVVVSLIGALFGIAFTVTGQEYRREKVNTVAIELASWLEAVRSASQRQPGTSLCKVNFSTTTPVSAGAILAEMDSTSPSSCASETSFKVRSFSNNSDSFTIALNPATPTTITFTPRGTVSATTDTTVRIQLVGTSDMRCVRLTATIGLIRIGSGTTTASDCTSYSVY